jgi:hypothetical protein
MARRPKASDKGSDSGSGRIPLYLVKSKSIAAAGYDRARRTFRVIFAGGGAYDYLSVPAKAYADFLSAPSKGRFVNWRIKPVYPFIRLT